MYSASWSSSYVFNLIDRNILSILAEDIKADLGITDGQMGFC